MLVCFLLSTFPSLRLARIKEWGICKSMMPFNWIHFIRVKDVTCSYVLLMQATISIPWTILGPAAIPSSGLGPGGFKALVSVSSYDRDGQLTGSSHRREGEHLAATLLYTAATVYSMRIVYMPALLLRNKYQHSCLELGGGFQNCLSNRLWKWLLTG